MSKYTTDKPAIIYILGPSIENKQPEDFILIKIGLSNNNPRAFEQRLAEHQRHSPEDIELASFESIERRDAPVRKYLLKNWPDKFGIISTQRGHEVIKLRAKDLQFAIDNAAAFLNGVNIGNAKVNDFPMRKEQMECLAKTIAFYHEEGREFLWDAKMRFGKTHVALQLIAAMGFSRVLILTGRPTDTKEAWLKEMDHVDFPFDEDNFIDASLFAKSIDLNQDKTLIVFSSLQDFVNRQEEDGLKEKFKHFPQTEFDLIIFDECHLACDTDKTKAAVSKLNFKRSLWLSGTPFKALIEERFQDQAKYSWSYIDEQKARASEIASLGLKKAQTEGQYYALSPMSIFTILLSPKLYKDVNLFTDEEGFRFSKLFVTKEDKFVNDYAVGLFIEAMCYGVLPFSKQAHIAKRYQSENLKHSLWSVPGVREAEFLAKKLRSHRVFKRYEIIVAAGSNNDGEGQDTVALVKRKIADVENGRSIKQGTITLSCGKLRHGISVPEWGSVFILSDMKSPAEYFQTIFRCQTPWKNKNGECIKHECYVFDFNPNRTLEHINFLAKKIASTGDILQAQRELLEVFNVLCYEDTEFNRIDASELITKLDAGFGRTNGMVGLQRLFDDVKIELDDTLMEDLASIELSDMDDSDINVNEHQIANGKHSKSKNKPESNAGKERTSPTSDKDLLRKAREMMSLIPTYISMTRDSSFDDLVNGLTSNKLCFKVMGMRYPSVKKILRQLSQEQKQRLNNGIARFRIYENKTITAT